MPIAVVHPPHFRLHALRAPATYGLLALFVWYGAVYLTLRGLTQCGRGLAHLYWRLRRIP